MPNNQYSWSLQLHAMLVHELQKWRMENLHPSYFQFTHNVEDLLFKGVTVSSVAGMIGLCLGVAAFSAIYESIIASRRYMVEVQKCTEDSISVRSTRSRLEESSEAGTPIHRTCKPSRVATLTEAVLEPGTWNKLKFHVIQTFLYCLQVSMGFCVMLIVMHYNGWLAISVLLASGIAHYIIGVLVFRRPVTLLTAADVMIPLHSDMGNGKHSSHVHV